MYFFPEKNPFKNVIFEENSPSGWFLESSELGKVIILIIKFYYFNVIIL
jgi:hypothetical protein